MYGIDAALSLSGKRQEYIRREQEINMGSVCGICGADMLDGLCRNKKCKSRIKKKKNNIKE